MQLRMTPTLLILCGSVDAHLRAPANNTAPLHESLAPDTSDHEADALRAKIESTVFAGVLRFEDVNGGNEKANAPPASPLQMQIPEKELKSLTEKLTAQCKEQFMAIIQGKGPAMHTFGAPGTKASAKSCRELDGGLCSMKAHVMQQKDMQSRQLSSETDVSGDGCLPNKCMQSTDLDVLSGFMQTKAKEALPGIGNMVKLSVDCSKAGGSAAVAGSHTPVVRSATKERVGQGGVPARGPLLTLLAALASISFAF